MYNPFVIVNIFSVTVTVYSYIYFAIKLRNSVTFQHCK